MPVSIPIFLQDTPSSPISPALALRIAEACPQVRYIKVDTEGFDRAVVPSLAGLIRSARPCIRSEIHKSMPAGDRLAFFGELQSLGYRLFKWQQDDYRSEELAETSMTRWKHFDLFAEPTAFTPRGEG